MPTEHGNWTLLTRHRIRCYIGGELKSQAEYSKRQLTKFQGGFNSGAATAQNSGISCRAHTEPAKELRCEGPCGLYKILDDFSRGARSSNHQTWCRDCTDWQTKNEPGFVPWMTPNEALHLRDRQNLADRPLNSDMQLADDMAWMSADGTPATHPATHSVKGAGPDIDQEEGRSRFCDIPSDRWAREPDAPGSQHEEEVIPGRTSYHASSAATEASADTTQAGKDAAEDGRNAFVKYTAYGPDGQKETRKKALTVYSETTATTAASNTTKQQVSRSGWAKPVSPPSYRAARVREYFINTRHSPSGRRPSTHRNTSRTP